MKGKLIRKVASVSVTVSMLLMVAGPAAGQTIDELLASIAALQAQLLALQGQQTGAYNFTRNLFVGVRGDDVTALQGYLKTGGYFAPAATGYFGPITRAAVAAWQAANGVAPAAGYFGAISRAKYAALIAPIVSPTPEVSPSPSPTPVSAAMTVELAPDSPAAANLWRGSANNVVLKVRINGGASAVSVTGLTVKSFGTTEVTGTTDVSAVKVFDENFIQLGTDRTLAGGIATFVFVPAVAVSANGSRTLSVAVNVGSSAQVIATVQYGIEAATAVSGATFGGTFPLKGSSFTIVPAGSIGALSLADFGSVPYTTVKIGEKDRVLEQFVVSAGANEDINLTQINIENTGTISDSDITNVRVREVNAAVVAGPVNLASKKATLNLAAPVLLAKGTAKNYEVIADIASGDARTIIMRVNSVVGTGKDSGVGVSGATATTGTTITIGAGTLIVSMSTDHPQGSAALMIKSTTRKTLAVFDVRAQGEDIILNTIQFKFNATDDLSSSEYLSSVGLYDGDALVSNLVSSIAVETDQDFSVNWTIPANTTKKLAVKAVTSNLGADDDTLISTFSGYSGYGLSSGNALTSAADFVSTGITIYQTGAFTQAVDTDKLLYNQGILRPANVVTLGAFKIFPTREDMKLKSLAITIAPAGASTTALSSMTLYDAAGTSALSVPVAQSAGVHTFAATDLLAEVLFTKSVYKTLVLKGNVSEPADQTGFTLTVATTTLTGKDSGTDVTNTGLAMAVSSPFAGGTYTLDNVIVQAAKDAVSPSGTVSRGSYVKLAIWQLDNMRADLASAVFTSLTLTSKTGISTGQTGATNSGDALLYRLYDDDTNIQLTYATTTLTQTTGTVLFSGASMITAAYGTPKKISLRVDTTNTAKFPSSNQMHWTIAAVGDALVTDGFVGYANKASIPADTNVVTMP